MDWAGDGVPNNMRYTTPSLSISGVVVEVDMSVCGVWLCCGVMGVELGEVTSWCARDGWPVKSMRTSTV